MPINASRTLVKETKNGKFALISAIF